MERLPTLLDEVGTLPPEHMPDDFDGIKFLMNLEAEGTPREQIRLRIAGELARRAFNHAAQESCYICKQRAAEYQAYIDRFPIGDPRD